MYLRSFTQKPIFGDGVSFCVFDEKHHVCFGTQISADIFDPTMKPPKVMKILKEEQE